MVATEPALALIATTLVVLVLLTVGAIHYTRETLSAEHDEEDASGGHAA